MDWSERQDVAKRVKKWGESIVKDNLTVERMLLDLEALKKRLLRIADKSKQRRLL